MQIKTATAVHLLIEYVPSAIYTALILLDIASCTKNGILACLFWRNFGVQIFAWLGVLHHFLPGMELVYGIERSLVVGQEAQPIVTSVISQTKPTKYSLS